MNRADANFSAIAGVVLLCAGLLLIGWLGDKSGLIDALGLRPQPVATPRAANLKR